MALFRYLSCSLQPFLRLQQNVWKTITFYIFVNTNVLFFFKAVFKRQKLTQAEKHLRLIGKECYVRFQILKPTRLYTTYTSKLKVPLVINIAENPLIAYKPYFLPVANIFLLFSHNTFGYFIGTICIQNGVKHIVKLMSLLLYCPIIISIV